MHELPTGTVTLLFSDIEGSTHLLQQLGDRYALVLSECRRLLREAFQHWNGYEVDTQGDAFFVAFARASDGVSAAVDAQRTLATHAWPKDVTVRVRMGLHTGEPELASEGYIGLDVHRAARIMHAGHGGQVLLSQTTRELVEHTLPEGVQLRDLEEHRLKDLQRPTRLFQLVIADLPADFPPLKTLNVHPHNLPVQPTPLIGREREVSSVCQLLRREEVRLLTLTGPGGTGKTRLGLQVAAEQSDLFSDGVYFVNLAPISDPELVVPTIAQTLELKETGAQPLSDLLKTSLRDKRLLLLLDNFEQVVSAAMQVADLLAACPKLKIMVTSREVLHVRGEQEFAVPPLAVPDPNHLPDLVALSQYEAVALFISRAQAVKPEFQLTAANALAVAETCVRLDGLPLTIELAAARIKLLPPQALLTRLGERLAVLTSGPRDVPMRQQTLRNTIAWSYDILNADEQLLFRRLAVFVGGCTLEAVEAICEALGDKTGEVFDGVASLIDKSLVQQRAQREEPRLVMLETIREYGLECLQRTGELAVAKRAYAAYYLRLVEKAEPKLRETEQLAWLEREHDNLQTTLHWFLEQNEMELVLRLSEALLLFWELRGHISEGRRWLEIGLEDRSSVSVPVQARALYSAGMLAAVQGDFDGGRVLSAESLRLFRALGDKRGIAAALSVLGYITCSVDDAVVGRAMLEESLALSRELGDRYRIAEDLAYLGNVAEWRDEYSGALALYEESLAICREFKNDTMCYVLDHLANIYFFQGDYPTAYKLYKESLTINEEVEHRRGIASSHHLLSRLLLYQGDFAQAYPMAEKSLLLFREIADKGHIAASLTILGQLAFYQHNYAAAHSLLEESLTFYKETGIQHGIAHSLSLLARVAFGQGDGARASSLYKESFNLQTKATARKQMAECLEGLGQVVAVEGEPTWAAQLWGAAEALRDALGAPLPPVYHADYDRSVAAVRSSLGVKAFAKAWAEGRIMTPEQVLTAQGQAAESIPISAGQPSTTTVKTLPTYPAGLTAREVEVLCLVAQGLTDVQVAEQLVISPRTVNFHLTSVYGKIGVSSRSAATRYAIEQHLV
jgi:predicted ATPase/class 3 adenylate cyclase/DNA-binding CsgD family transcriptional regulator